MTLIHAADMGFFSKELDTLDCLSETKAYIVSIFSKYMKSAHDDFSRESLTLLYSKAREEHNFIIYQNLGDWIFFSQTMFPKSLDAASPEYYQTIARSSYYSCYKLINKKWKVFEELSDNFTYLEDKTIRILQKKS
jgi:hypothetical protein